MVGPLINSSGHLLLLNQASDNYLLEITNFKVFVLHHKRKLTKQRSNLKTGDTSLTNFNYLYLATVRRNDPNISLFDLLPASHIQQVLSILNYDLYLCSVEERWTVTLTLINPFNTVEQYWKVLK